MTRSDPDRRARVRRALELMGELEPTTTRDETGEGWGEQAAGSRDDDLRRDVPPHHGD